MLSHLHYIFYQFRVDKPIDESEMKQGHPNQIDILTILIQIIGQLLKN